jgi:hypothetical protein
MEELELYLKNKHNSFQDLEADLCDLRHFKSANTLDPEANVKQLKALTEKFSNLLEAHKKEQDDFLLKFAEEREIANRAVINKVMEIVESAKNGLSAVMRNKTFAAHQENFRLKKETQYQRSAHIVMEAEIKDAEEKLRINKLAAKIPQKDNLRWRLKDKMNCTPDMDPVIC